MDSQQVCIIDAKCPIGCGVEIALVKCLPSGRIAGFCWGCTVTQPVPLPLDYKLVDGDIDPFKYATDGLTLPQWEEVEAAGLSPLVIQKLPTFDWHGMWYLERINASVSEKPSD